MVKKELLQQVLALKASDREQLCDVVQASLGNELPPQLNAAERKRLLKMSEHYTKHPEQLLSWKQVKTLLAKQRAERSR